MKRTANKGVIWKLCILSCLLPLCVPGQETSDAAIAQLNGVLASGNEAELKSLEQRLMSAPASMSTLLAVGVVLAQHEKFADAATVFDFCSRRFPESFEAKYNLALARVGLTEYSDAFSALNSITPKTGNQRAAVEYLSGKVFLATNHLKEAQKSLADAYAQQPAEENYALDLSLLYIRSAAYVKAIEVLQSSLAIHPKSGDLALELALADVLAGRFAEGIALCRTLQEQDVSSSTTRLIAAFAYCAEKNYKASETEATAGLRLAQPNPYLYYLRARAVWDSGVSNGREVMDDLSRAIQQMPSCGVCLMLRSRVFEALNEDDSAIADLKKALDSNSNQAAAWYRLSVLYRKAGLPQKASDALQHFRSMRGDGSDEEVENFRKLFLDGISPQTTQ